MKSLQKLFGASHRSPDTSRAQLAEHSSSPASRGSPAPEPVQQPVELPPAQGDGEPGSPNKGKPHAPSSFYCPVSMELMADPVMVATGHTYDRACIEKWLQQGNRTCPVTGMRLRHLELIPNYALRTAIQVWDLNSLQRLKTLAGHSDAVRALCVAEGRLFSGSYDGTVRVWDESSLQCVAVLRGHTGPVRTLVYCSGLIFSGSYDKTVRVWDVASLQCQATLTGHTGAVRALVASPHRVFSGSDDTTIKVWDVESFSCLKTLEGHEDNVRVLTVGQQQMFSGSWDKTIRVWDIASLECVRVLEGHTEAVLALAVSDTHLVSGSYDTTVRFWDLASFRCTRKCDGHEDAVRVLAAAGGSVFSGSYDGTIGSSRVPLPWLFALSVLAFLGGRFVTQMDQLPDPKPELKEPDHDRRRKGQLIREHLQNLVIKQELAFTPKRPIKPSPIGELHARSIRASSILSWFPRIVVYPAFVDKARCETIIKVATQRMYPSGLAYRPGEHVEGEQQTRTSKGTFLAAGSDGEGVLEWVEERIAAITMLPRENGEPFNVLQYQHMQHYDSHMDSFDPKDFGPQPSQRIATVLIYLSAPEEGGETVFKKEGLHGDKKEITDWRNCDDGSFKYKPRQGDAVLFWGVTPDQTIDPRSLHGGCPVVSGEKWATLEWIISKLGGSGPDADEKLEKLQRDNDELHNRLDELAKQQAGIHSLKDLPNRVKALEDRVKYIGEALQPAVPSEAEGGDPASQDTPGDLSERVVSLEAQLADLQQAHTIGPTPADLASQLSSLRKHVDDKVDRAEFDALLASGAAAGALMGDDIPRVELAEDGTIDVKALAEGVNRSLGDCGALRAMTMVLQERVASKASQASIEAVESLVEGLKGKVDTLSSPGPQVSASSCCCLPPDPPVRLLQPAARLALVMKQNVSACLPAYLLQLDKAAQPSQPSGSQGELDSLVSRLAALELKLELGGAGSSTPAAAAAAANAASRHAVDGQLDQVKTVADMLPLTKQIFDALGNKADRGALEGLYTKLADLTSKMDSLATRTAAAERAVSDATGKAVPSELSGNVAADSGVGSGQRFEERLGDIETELGGLADALRLLQEAFAPVEPRHEEVTAQIKEVLDTLANKADVPSLDELRLQIALASAGLPAGTADGDALMSAMQRVVADKATKVGRQSCVQYVKTRDGAELEVVKKQLDTKASSDQVRSLAAAASKAAAEAAAAADVASEHLSPAASPPPLVLGGEGLGGLRGEGLQQPSATLAAKADLEALAQQVGDLCSDLAELRSRLTGLELGQGSKPSSLAALHPPATGLGLDAEALVKTLAALGKELAGLRDQQELLAHASNIMAVGLELPSHAAAAAGAEGGGLSDGGPPGLVGGREPRTPRGAVERLVKLVGRQAVGHKMDWFDPDVLNRMAQKLGTVDALMMNPAFRSMAQAPDAGMRDLENQLRRVVRDVRTLKERVTDLPVPGQRNPESDHAMLAGKALLGYRQVTHPTPPAPSRTAGPVPQATIASSSGTCMCMACDRPLERLDEKPGPYIPTYQMPVKVPAAPDTSSKEMTCHLPSLFLEQSACLCIGKEGSSAMFPKRLSKCQHGKGKGIAETREYVFDPDTQLGVGIDPGVTQAVSAASGVWDQESGQLVADQLDRWKLTKGQHITVTLATWDAVWEVYLDPKWAQQRLRLYGAQDPGAGAVLQEGPRAQTSCGAGWCLFEFECVFEHRTTGVSSAVNGQQPCEEELDCEQPARRATWKPPAGQVEHRLLRPAWSQQRDQPVWGLMWCPVVAPRKPPQAPGSSQAATPAAASEPGPSTPPPAKRNKCTEAEQAAEPTKGKGKAKGKAAKAKPAYNQRMSFMPNLHYSPRGQAIV
ncbi:hypothetical protein QJQ45_003294 [Haematococcus lacustris]|nr:hypothetical protein QJQ45_003294 [Haematococcus lacustris]